jgi:formylglycine-generating enzyme
MKRALQFAAHVALLGACANLVGIEDTVVTQAGGTSGGGQSGADSGGSSASAGSAATGGGSSGTGANAGSDASGGSNPGAGGESNAAGASSAGAGTGGAPDCGVCAPQTPSCEQGQCVVRGPTLVGVSDFFMDATEVTTGQYKEFLAAKGADVSGQPAVCDWNTTYELGDGELGDDNSIPIAYVDWCDAWAFCDWSDKRLCGAIDGTTLAIEDDLFDETKSQWFRGCGGPSGDSHPAIGGEYQECNDDSNVLVAAGSTCEGYATGLFDTQGNANEWIDFCVGTDGATDQCYSLGGSYVGVGSGYCSESAVWNRSDRYGPLGFRCCNE